MINWSSFFIGVAATVLAELVLVILALTVGRIWMLWKGNSPIG
jgi:hypothetical protein